MRYLSTHRFGMSFAGASPESGNVSPAFFGPRGPLPNRPNSGAFAAGGGGAGNKLHQEVRVPPSGFAAGGPAWAVTGGSRARVTARRPRRERVMFNPSCGGT